MGWNLFETKSIVAASLLLPLSFYWSKETSTPGKKTSFLSEWWRAKETLNGGRFTLATQLITLNYSWILPEDII